MGGNMVFRKTVLTFVFLTLLTLAAHADTAEMNNIQARIFIDSKAQWFQLLETHPDIVWKENDYVEIITSQEQLDNLIGLGFRTEYVQRDLKKFLQSRLEDRAMGGYKTLSEIYDYLDGIVADHPDIVSTKLNLGYTIEGRPMWAVKISDNPNVDEEETEILFTSAIHAREVITPEVLFNFMDSLTDKYGVDPVITDVVDNREMWFVVVVNPDGYYHNEVIAPGGGGMWRKNRRDNGDGTYGVDLNRNYGYLWGYDNEGSSPYGYDETYRGTAAFSEPETQNMRDFALAHEFAISVYYHSFSNLILWPWGYEYDAYTPDQALFQAMGDSMSAFNGYNPTVSWGLYPTNGASDDWHYGEQTLKDKNLSFTFEVGSHEDNFWPPTERIPDLINENYEPLLLTAKIADQPQIVMAPIQPAIVLEDTVDNSWYQVQWIHDDEYNPGEVYELTELQDIQISTDTVVDFSNFITEGFLLTYSRYYSRWNSFWSDMKNSRIEYLQLKEPYTVSDGDQITFWTYYTIETDYDYAYVEVSTDGSIFTPLEGNITTNDNPNGNNRGNGITGSSGGEWVEGIFDLDDYIGQAVYIRFSYYTDPAVLEEGIYLDNIYPVVKFETETVISSSITDMFYTFTDKTDGEDYYYKVRAKDAQNQWGNYSLTGKTHARVPYTCGDLDDDGLINILDVVFLINYIYKSGTAPDPLTSADVDGDSAINILDVVYLINYIYKSGPEPDCP